MKRMTEKQTIEMSGNMNKITLIETSKEHGECFDILVDGEWILAVGHCPPEDKSHRRFNDCVNTLECLLSPLGKVYELEVIWD